MFKRYRVNFYAVGFVACNGLILLCLRCVQLHNSGSMLSNVPCECGIVTFFLRLPSNGYANVATESSQNADFQQIYCVDLLIADVVICRLPLAININQHAIRALYALSI